MITFGIISLHLRHEEEYITELAKRALPYNITVYHFTPTSIDIPTQQVDGHRFSHQEQTWEETTFPIPQFLYDRCFYQQDFLSKKSTTIMAWLKKNPTTTFIGYGLPNKWHIYEALTTNHILAPFLPETKKIESTAQIMQVLKAENKIILKPINGSQGRGIIKMMRKRKQMIIETDQNHVILKKQFSKEKDLHHWLEDLLIKQDYLIQPFLFLQNEDNEPFDIRIFLQKDETGQWQERGRGIRKGKKDFFVSNLSCGAEVLSFDDWIQTFSMEEQTSLQKKLLTIVEHIPTTLEHHFPPLFELGIDIGVDKQYHPWILDTNSKPGRKVICTTNPFTKEVLYHAPLKYCFQIAKTLEGVTK